MVVAIKDAGIAYMPTPKVACTSVKVALSQLDPSVRQSVDELMADPFLIHDIYPTMRFRPHRWEEYEQGWWRFAVVRDPLKRLLSVYTDRVQEKDELKNSRRLREHPELPKAPDADAFFQNIKGYIDVSSMIKHHALPQRLYVGPSPLDFDAVYKVEQLGDLADALSEKAGKPIIIPRLNKSSETLSFDDLAPKTQDVLRARLREEYEDLKGYYENPM